MTDMDDYQKAAAKFAKYPPENGVVYCVLGLVGESGELAGKASKIIRDGSTPGDRSALAMELGDVLWFVAALATELGYSLQDVADMNLKKLQDRQARGKIGGSGDDR